MHIAKPLRNYDGLADDHGGAQAGSQAKKQHAPALVAAKRLHGSVIDQLHGSPKPLLVIEIHPALAQIVRLAYQTGV